MINNLKNKEKGELPQLDKEQPPKNLQIISYLGKIPLKIRSKARLSPLTTLFQHHTGSSTNIIGQEKEIKHTYLEVRNKIILVHR